MERDQELRRVVSFITEAGYQIEKGAFDLLREALGTLDLDLLVKSALEEAGNLPQRPFLLSREILERKMVELHPDAGPSASSPPTAKRRFQPYAKEVEADVEVVEDPTERLSTTGSLQNYIEYFQDRYRRLRQIMSNRMDTRDALTIPQALKAQANSKVKFICAVAHKRESARGVFLQVEDLEGDATVFVPTNNRRLLQKGQRLILDQVVCICAAKGRADLFVAEDIIPPDIPMRTPSKAPIPVYAALLSDLHVGSRMFMRKSFERFVLWLRGDIGNEDLREVAGHVKYVVIAGDTVDGVGVYPQQIEELEIDDIYRQYEEAAGVIGKIPEYMEVVVIPGNHDASRRALPQPAIRKDYVEPFCEWREVRFLANPSTVSLHGVTVLLAHGRSLDDVISTVPGMSFQMPDEAMKLLLQCRHLAPTYGSRTLIASEREDHLVIERVPDIFHAGHVHVMRHSTYRGTLIVNSGAWQEQTEYQREMGHTPNPGVVPIVDLQTLRVIPLSFV